MFTSTATRTGDDVCLTLAGELDFPDRCHLRQSIDRARLGPLDPGGPYSRP